MNQPGQKDYPGQLGWASHTSEKQMYKKLDEGGGQLKALLSGTNPHLPLMTTSLRCVVTSPALLRFYISIGVKLKV